ncbi:MAG: cation:proton antiporter [Planctomycetota bacterium]|jgi:hypothetical protein
MEGFLALVLVLSVSLLASSSTAARLRRSRPIALLLSGGWLWIMLGAAIGPSGLGAVDHATTRGMAPLISFVLGWIGLMIGLGAHRSIFQTLPSSVRRVTSLDTLLCVVVMGGVTLIVVSTMRERFNDQTVGTHEVVWLTGLMIVCGLGWSLETRSLRSNETDAGMLSMTVRGGGGLGALLSVGLWGWFCLVVTRNAGGGMLHDWVHIVQAFVALSLSVLLIGLVTRSSLRLAGESSPEMLTVFLGVVALLGGVAMRMGLPAILGGMLAGVLLTNLAGKELRRFERFLVQAEHVVAVSLSLVAGMLIDIRFGLGGLALAAALCAARVVFKPLVLTSGQPHGSVPAGTLVRFVGIRQSPVALALGVGFVMSRPDDPWTHGVLGIIVVTGLLSELLPLWKTLERRAAPMTTTTTPDLETGPAAEEARQADEDSEVDAPDDVETNERAAGEGGA